MTAYKVHKEDLLFPELSFQVVGILFEVHNTLGYGYLEKYYQKAIAALLTKAKIKFIEQALVEIVIAGEVVAKGYADFIIDDKIILEIKCLPVLTFREKKQVWYYLKGTEYKLLLLVNFGGRKLEIVRRIYDKARFKDRS